MLESTEHVKTAFKRFWNNFENRTGRNVDLILFEASNSVKNLLFARKYRARWNDFEDVNMWENVGRNVDLNIIHSFWRLKCCHNPAVFSKAQSTVKRFSRGFEAFSRIEFPNFVRKCWKKWWSQHHSISLKSLILSKPGCLLEGTERIKTVLKNFEPIFRIDLLQNLWENVAKNFGLNIIQHLWSLKFCQKPAVYSKTQSTLKRLLTTIRHLKKFEFWWNLLS